MFFVCVAKPGSVVQLTTNMSKPQSFLLKLNPTQPNEGILSGSAFPTSIRVRLLVPRRGPHADALVTDGNQTWMIKSSCIVCGEDEAGKRRLEIMQAIYELIQNGEFSEARRVFFHMQRVLL